MPIDKEEFAAGAVRSARVRLDDAIPHQRDQYANGTGGHLVPAARHEIEVRSRGKVGINVQSVPIALDSFGGCATRSSAPALPDGGVPLYAAKWSRPAGQMRRHIIVLI